MARVLITHPQMPDPLKLLSDHEVITSDHVLSDAELSAQISEVDAVLTCLNDRLDAEMIAKAKRLKIIAQCAAGYNNIDLLAASQAGIVVTSTPGVLHEATANLAFTLMLMVARRAGEAERLVRARKPWYFDHSFMLGMGIQGATLGIIGLGQIGEAMARRGAAVGMNVIYTAHSDKDVSAIDATNPHTEPTRRASTDELLASSDVVSLHCPLTTETRHIIDRDALAMMKPSAYLINTARGACVDEKALAEALSTGQIAGAGLDVFEDEPNICEPLYGMENVVLLPHIGSAERPTREKMTELAVKNILSVLNGEEPLTPVPLP